MKNIWPPFQAGRLLRSCKERERLSVALFTSGGVKGISETITKVSCGIKVPFGFKIADHQKDFIAEANQSQDDKDVFIARKSMVQWKTSKKKQPSLRDEVCSKYLW